ncbi:hypothetical protein A2Y83_04175 [Candidatus Falkowbacteria bacterium RBG_13_39_14]|uniref:Calcineurin-like phosphoesterase domain-containing protein n=1 Tax=Candidatus Falkowbacteria bacterium RBG_13_39_14 TaxID=1797985 RepID=A0A1F5S2T9_9BACT|nr:MAG: hypothetical protein A2Y83_04175 [Candidatus Falkowbacteria bacterium RBG_13_39_14]
MQEILYTSDIHGNEAQYKKLTDYAVQIKADFVIIGGDILPKNFSKDIFIFKQRKFLENRFPELLYPLKNKLPKCKVFLMMGNDDCAANMDVLERYDKDLVYLIGNKRMKMTESFDIAGYPYVPITPFGIKDWEKYDFSDPPQNLLARYLERKRTNYRLEAKKSSQTGWEKFIFTPEIEKEDSIQKDLSQELFLKNPKKTIYVFHTPPDNTNLDLTSPLARSGGAHVGSMALRSFIEKCQPYLTLHGHIHETVKMSEEFRDKIGDTLCMAAGNDNMGDELAVLVFDIDKPERAERMVM